MLPGPSPPVSHSRSRPELPRPSRGMTRRRAALSGILCPSLPHPTRYRAGSARPRSPWSRGRSRRRGRARRAGSAGCRRRPGRGTASTATATAAAAAPSRRRAAVPWPRREPGAGQLVPLRSCLRSAGSPLSPAPSRPSRFYPLSPFPLLLLLLLLSAGRPRPVSRRWEPPRAPAGPGAGRRRLRVTLSPSTAP